jgi:hypothetical protein
MAERSLPELEELRGYSYELWDTCHEIAEALAHDYPGLRHVEGAVEGGWPHAWCVDDDGIIYDPVAGAMFAELEPGPRIIDSDDPLRQRYVAGANQ